MMSGIIKIESSYNVLKGAFAKKINLKIIENNYLWSMIDVKKKSKFDEDNQDEDIVVCDTFAQDAFVPCFGMDHLEIQPAVIFLINSSTWNFHDT